jgi:Cys-tRNA(Pro)/Cys-tRNA(Cys) deacylase
MQERLLEILNEQSVTYEPFEFTESVHTVDQAVDATKSSYDQVIKNVVLKGKSGSYFVVTVKGADRLDFKRLEEIVGEKVRMAKPDEVLEYVGYPVGGVPSFGVDGVKYFVDEEVMSQKMIYTSGGDDRSLIGIAPLDMVKVSGAEVIECVK